LKAQIQANYENRLRRYAVLIHGNEPPGLVAKLAVYSSLLQQHALGGDRLWKVEPLLYTLIQSVEVDLHLATAKLLEKVGRSDRSVFAFLDFCLKNRTLISWRDGPPAEDVLQEQLVELENHRPTITTLMVRRDKFFAHLDKAYFADPGAIYTDYPLAEADVVALVNCIIRIITTHESSLKDQWSVHLGEFYHVAVDNMVRNLEAGRKLNFPGQLD